MQLYLFTSHIADIDNSFIFAIYFRELKKTEKNYAGTILEMFLKLQVEMTKGRL